MGWISSLFGGFDGSQNSRRNQAISSTDEAFSLPTSSPVHPDAFNPELLETPGSQASFTYPPLQSADSTRMSFGGYFTTSSKSRPNSLLPLHQPSSPLSPPASYPPLPQTWARLRTWLHRNYPELGDTLNYGILPQDLAQIEMQFGFALPQPVRESYLQVDGQEAESAAGCSDGLFFGLTLLPLEDVLEEWRFWREVDEDPATGGNVRLREVMRSVPPDWVRREYSQRGWIPLVADKAGNYIGVDLNPDKGGAVGQVIVFGRDFDTKVVLWSGDGPAGWARWLANFVDDLESGDGYELETHNAEGSDNSEDDIGYESYFFDGGRGQGDGGGVSGPTSMRLTGEYRGWNVLEAWADKSLKKWRDAGVLPEDTFAPSEEKKKRMTLALDESILGFAAVAGGSGAEVPIPVVKDDSAPHVEHNSPIVNGPVPAISISKPPPTPLPVAIPTPSDIASLPSPPDSTASSDVDSEEEEESGRAPIRDIEHGLSPRKMDKGSHPLMHSRSSSRRSIGQIDGPASPTSHLPTQSGSGMSDITDLLVDTEITSNDESVSSKVSTSAISPVVSSSGSVSSEIHTTSGPVSETGSSAVDVVSPTDLPQPVVTAAVSEPVAVTATASAVSDETTEESEGDEEEEEEEEEEGEEEEEEEEGEEEEPAQTIRLVGGGGTSGVMEESPVEEEVPAVDAAEDLSPAPAPEESPSTPPPATSDKDGKQEKHRKSLSSGLRKLAGGKKKSDSVSSVKTITKDTA